VTGLDAADLVVIAGRTLGIGTDAALSAMDIRAAQAALAEAQPPGREPDAALPGRDAAAAASVGLVHALLRHRPFPSQAQQVAVSAGLQFLAINGWQADLNPPATTAVVIDALASGKLTADDAAAWLSQRLRPAPRAHRSPRDRRAPAAARQPGPRPSRPLPSPAIRVLAGALATAMVGGVAGLATACSRAPDMSSAATARPHSVAGTSQETGGARAAGLAYAACMRSHGIREFPEPSLGGVVVIAPGTGIDPGSPLFHSAEQACQALTRTAGIHIVTA
jgi:hypothetical protein